MGAEQRTSDADRATRSRIPERSGREMAAGAAVVLLRPRRLRGTIGVVRRPMPGGWEVEIRSALGTPLHLTLPERALHLR